ncbi:MAG TPA: LON peptidase substrate-binding domain-containing protein [Propionibacteriaceae bacterium]|nr:LON peptidase substrate-binding domain-containing protein [Propionibacteriaceae bacterium]
METLPMFPLGSVLFPHMPLRLRVFERRYLVMLAGLLSSGTAEFGVVLIERGQEVGGGEQRFDVGTVAQIVELASEGDVIGLVAQGGHRIQVAQWLEEDPHPVARVDRLPELSWDEQARPLLDQAEQTVRRCLAMASEFERSAWAADVELANDPVALAWQLAGIAPLGPLDQLRLLRAITVTQLLEDLMSLTAEAAETWTAWGEDLE